MKDRRVIFHLWKRNVIFVFRSLFLAPNSAHHQENQTLILGSANEALKKTLTLWPLFFFTDGVQLPQGYSHFEGAVYFLPFSSQNFLVPLLCCGLPLFWRSKNQVSPILSHSSSFSIQPLAQQINWLDSKRGPHWHSMG